MSETANEIFQWIGVGVVLIICLLYIVKRKSKKGGKKEIDYSGCEGCPLSKDCSKRNCDDKPKKHSSHSCCN